MTEFTIYTPTYNRAHTLQRVYDCLKNQTYKDFIWLIVDDGSTDNTKELVDIWINDAILKITYLYKQNGGKHSAMELAHNSINTKYVIGLDSDDILLPDAVETFYYQWKLIENQGLESEIAEIRAFSKDIKGQIVGGDLSMFNQNKTYIDTTWQKWVLKWGNYHEMIMAHNTSKLNECVVISNYKYKIDKIKFISEGVFWASIGRKYKTRYINYIARVYYQDDISLTRPKNKDRNRFYQTLVSSLYIVDENLNFFWYNPLFFIKSIFLFLISGFYVNEKFRYQLKQIGNIYLRFISILFYPVSYVIYLFLKYIRKLN